MTEKKSKTILDDCLYFTANSLARVITRMAEEEFKTTGLSPSHAFLVMLVNDNPGITQKELSGILQLAPSTVTRFIDSIVYKGHIERKTEGKISKIYPTENGENLRKKIEKSWKNLHTRYANILGLREGDALTAMIGAASDKLSDKK